MLRDFHMTFNVSYNFQPKKNASVYYLNMHNLKAIYHQRRRNKDRICVCFTQPLTLTLPPNTKVHNMNFKDARSAITASFTILTKFFEKVTPIVLEMKIL